MRKFQPLRLLRWRRRRAAALIRDRRGVVSVEIAIVVSVLSFLAIGVIDYSLAFARQSEMSNAVRAGVQFALVRRPSIGPSADEQESIISLQTIRQAVIDSARYLETDPGTDMLNAEVFCQCPDAQPVECVSQSGVPLSCTDRQTLLQITLVDQYSPIFRYPGLPEQFRLVAQQSVRLN